MTVTPARITVPSSDKAFETYVSRVDLDVMDPRELETRLRRLFPRVVGGAESRFRMPRADGGLVESESYTSVEGEEFLTVMRPAQASSLPVDAVAPQAAPAPASA